MNRNILSVSSGTSLAQAISFLVILITARIYSQSEFGQLGVLIGLAGILKIFFTLRLETLIVPSNQKEEIISTIAPVYIASKMLISLVIIYFAFSLFFEQSFSSTLNIFFSIIIAFLLSLILITENLLNKRKEYTKIASLKILLAFSIGVFAIGFGFIYQGNGLLFSQLFGTLVVAIIACYFVKDVFVFQKRKELSKYFKRNKKTPKFLVPAASIEAIFEQGTVILISYLFLNEIAGYFSLSWRIILVPMAVISYSVSLVYFQKLSELKNEGKDFSREQIIGWRNLAIFVIPLGIILFFFVEDLIKIILGDQWRYSGEIIKYLIPIMVIRFISAPTTMIYIVLKRLHYNLIFASIGLIARFGSIIYGYINDDFLLGVKIWVLLECTYVVVYCLLGYKLSREYPNKIKGAFN